MQRIVVIPLNHKTCFWFTLWPHSTPHFTCLHMHVASTTLTIRYQKTCTNILVLPNMCYYHLYQYSPCPINQVLYFSLLFSNLHSLPYYVPLCVHMTPFLPHGTNYISTFIIFHIRSISMSVLHNSFFFSSL